MGMTDADYLQALLHLLPPGQAYPRLLSGELALTLQAMADELARVDTRVDDLVNEIDPRTAVELLSDWERALSLSGESTDAVRQLAITAKLNETGGQSIAYFVQLAATLGFTVRITELVPYTCITAIDQPIYPEEIRFIWQVNILLAQAPGALLETIFNNLKPAHTAIVFMY